MQMSCWRPSVSVPRLDHRRGHTARGRDRIDDVWEPLNAGSIGRWTSTRAMSWPRSRSARGTLPRQSQPRPRPTERLKSAQPGESTPNRLRTVLSPVRPVPSPSA